MKLHSIISFLTGLIITALIIGFIYLCSLFLNFNLAGGETLSQIENQNILRLFVCILLLLFAIVYARQYFKKGKKSTAYGIIISPLIVVFTTMFYIAKPNFFPVKFDKTIWAKSKWKPDDMAKSLVKQKTLIGLTKIQVKQMLGEGAEEHGDTNADRGSILYNVENDWTLSVIFQKGKVVEVILRLPILGV